MMTLNLDTLKLDKGAHSAPEIGMCAMEAVSALAGLPWSDSPSCTDPVIASYIRALNDLMPDDQRQRLIPYIPRLASASNGVPQQTRAFLCADFAIHVFAPMALRSANQEPQALQQLESLPKVKDIPSAREAAASARATAARAAAAAAEAAVWAAAEAAAWAAAWAAEAAAEAVRAAAWDKSLELLDLLIEAKP